MRLYRVIFVSCLLISVSNCVFSDNGDLKSSQKQETRKTNKRSSIENVNRFFLNFNTMINHAFINPVTSSYDKVLPKGIKGRISDFLKNLMTPFYSICALLAGDVKESVRGIGAFVGNTL